MRAQALLDESATSSFGPQWERLEPVHVLFVEKHVADCDELFVDLVGVARQDYSFGDDAGSVGGLRGAGADKLEMV